LFPFGVCGRRGRWFAVADRSDLVADGAVTGGGAISRSSTGAHERIGARSDRLEENARPRMLSQRFVEVCFITSATSSLAKFQLRRRSGCGGGWGRFRDCLSSAPKRACRCVSKVEVRACLNRDLLWFAYALDSCGLPASTFSSQIVDYLFGPSGSVDFAL